MKLIKDKACFVCGPENQFGLKLKVEPLDNGGAKAIFLAEERYKGWSQYLHGGVISLIFDELLGWTSKYLDYDVLTARLNVRYRKPVLIGEKVIFTAKPYKINRKLLEIKTVAMLENGEIVAEGYGKMVIQNSLPKKI